jgi:hypothetical protein
MRTMHATGKGRPIENVLSRLRGVKQTMNGWDALCPAHDDSRPSLGVAVADDGTVLLRCRSNGCSAESICQAIGLTMRDLFPSTNANDKPKPRIVATYDYTDEAGILKYQSVRFDPKDFKQRRPAGNGQWTWNLNGTPRLLYHLPEIVNAPKQATIWIVEGEKDVETLREHELLATTNSGGAGKWPNNCNEVLHGRPVVILPDNDDAGRKHGRQVAAALQGIAASVRIVELPGLPEKGDVSDWFAAGGTASRLTELALVTPAWTERNSQAASQTDQEKHDGGAPDFSEPIRWLDPLADAAFLGLAGEIVRTIEPQSEADPAALLAQLLVGFGAALGRTANFQVEGSRHHLNEYVILVGQTSKARKGTSWDRIRKVLEYADPQFVEDRILGGLSSGEGLIWAVRDPIFKRHFVKKGGRIVDHQDYEDDPGVKDKRLLAFEPEFASVLRRIEGQTGNSLSALLRQGWEAGNLRTLTKTCPAKATGAHISLVAHVTVEELRRLLTATESANGFANRFMPFCVRRSKLLPEGGAPIIAELESLGRRLGEALAFGRTAGELHRGEEARAIWRSVYGLLSGGKPGLAGCLLARAEAHVMRVAAQYAVLGLSRTISDKHLMAALALWEYVERSVYLIFGDSLGDPLADDLLRLLRGCGPGGITRTEISNYLGKHQPTERVGRALGLLLENKLARFERLETSGRPSERWFAVKR